jgi:hypothetical protein
MLSEIHAVRIQQKDRLHSIFRCRIAENILPDKIYMVYAEISIIITKRVNEIRECVKNHPKIK